MVLMLGIPLGVLLGLALGGRPAALAGLHLRAMWLLYAAIAIQIVAFPSGVFPWTTPEDTAVALWLVSYGLLVVATALNVRIPGAAVIGAGMACNLTAVVANGGQMPALPSAIRGAGLSYEGVLNNSVASADPRVAWLVDRWAAPPWLPFGNVYSVGDVLIAAGTVLLVALAMQPRAPRLPGRRAAASA